MPIIKLTKDQWGTEVLQAKEKLVVVEFWGETCPKCQALAPQYEQLAEDPAFHGSVKFCSVNTTSNRMLAISQKVMSQPTVIVFRDGVQVTRFAREMFTIHALREVLVSLLG